ncbi:MAG TPA: hypothetical protein VGX76_10710 [Pirellulales bacterium]|nr:hypothetical protein [Pirellulales bacterium]
MAKHNVHPNRPPAPEPEPKKTNDGRREVPKHRQCPLCFEGRGNGVGKAYNSQQGKTYYMCDNCGHTWVVRVKRVVSSIEHREVELEERG